VVGAHPKGDMMTIKLIATEIEIKWIIQYNRSKKFLGIKRVRVKVKFGANEII
jgi:hypothetical protein